MRIVLHVAGLPATVQSVSSWGEASRAFRLFIERGGYGASNLGEGAGRVFRGTDQIGHVSYNGRCWDLDGAEILVEM
jgi:hypothetical protein